MRAFLRHTLATIAYRAAKVERYAPPGFGNFQLGKAARTPVEIISHMADLFDWAQSSIYGDVADGRAASDGIVLRNLQARYARQLGVLWTSPPAGTPDDARALARLKLEDLRHDVHAALGRSGLDEVTRAHLEELDAIANQALSAQTVVKP